MPAEGPADRTAARFSDHTHRLPGTPPEGGGVRTKIYVGRMLAKLNLRDRAQGVVIAYEICLVTSGGSS
jgi:hypothetical protein